jgi:hypothetical protein
MPKDFSKLSAMKYLEGIKPNFQEDVANHIFAGSKLQEALESPEGQALVDVIGEIYQLEFRELMTLVKEKQYTKDEEVWRIREHCIALTKLNDVLIRWKSKLNKLQGHIDKINELQ